MSRYMALQLIDWALDTLKNEKLDLATKIARVTTHLIDAHESVVNITEEKKK